ncbi:MAG: hypothetical protein AABZ08_02015 [Planctomycetota bacterium]
MDRYPSRLLTSVLILALVAPALAGPRNKGTLGQQDEPSASEGIEFHDPLVEECMELLRKGDAVAAMTKLEKEAGRAVGDQKAEIQLGLAMLYLRSGQQTKAKQTLSGLIARKDTGSVGNRTRILERVMKKYSPKKSGDLMDAEVWSQQLTSVAKDIAKDVVSEHQKVFPAMQKENWAQVAVQVAKAREHVNVAQEIKVGGAAGDVALKHIDGLANIVRQVNDDLDSGMARAHVLREQVREFERPRRNRIPGGQPPNANAKIDYNNLVHRLTAAWEASKLIDDELERLTEDYGGQRIKKKARLMPKTRLPVPI